MFASLARLANRTRPAPQHPYHHLLPRIIEGLGNGLPGDMDLGERLLPSVASACNYLDEQIQAIPGELEISEKSFYQADASSQFFGDPGSVGAALGKSLDVKSALPGLIQAGNDSVCAMLGMRPRRESDSRNIAPCFADHTLAALAPTEGDLRRFLRDLVFERFISNAASFRDGHPESGFSPRASRSGEDKLNALLGLLNAPERLFHMTTSGFSCRNKTAQPVELPLLHCSDRRQWIVCIVRFDTQEAFEAQGRELHKHRYIYF